MHRGPFCMFKNLVLFRVAPGDSCLELSAIEASLAKSPFEPPSSFTVDRECELKTPDDSKSAVRYARHALDIAEIQGHIQAGKVPTRLAITNRAGSLGV